MNPSRIFLLPGALLLSVTTAAGQGYLEVPGSWGVNDITPDGEVVCGVGPAGGFYWRWQVEPAPTFIGGNDAVALSDDGSVIVGCINAALGEEAAMWTQASGWQSLGYLPNALSCPSRSNAYDVTGDGTTVVGLSWDGCSGRGFIWTQATGMLELQNLVNGNNRASVIAADGSRIGGFAQGNFNRTPALWLPDTTGQVYDPNVVGEVYGLSDDGTIVVGQYNTAAFYDAGHGPVLIGSFNGAGWIGNAKDVTEDGGRIVGFDILNGTGVREATVWSPSTGWESLRDKLAGLHVAAPALQVCMAQTPGGEIIVGHSGFQGWIVTLPREVVNYCTAGISASGCSAMISSNGIPSATAPSGFTLKATNVEGSKDGIFFFGANGRQATSWGNGTSYFCVVPPVSRGGLLTSVGTNGQCDGSFTQDLNARWTAKPAQNPGAGAVTQAQLWYRDPGNTSSVTTSLSNAIEFVVAP